MKVSIVLDMQRRFFSHTFQRYEIVAPNIYFEWSSEMDLLGVRKSGFIDEIEIKISRSDFLADFRKKAHIKSKYPCLYGVDGNGYSHEGHFQKNKHEAMQSGEMFCNYFSFLLPERLAEQCEIPEYAGLYIYKEYENGHTRVSEVKTASRLHKRKITEQQKYHIGRKMAYRYWEMVKTQ